MLSRHQKNRLKRFIEIFENEFNEAKEAMEKLQTISKRFSNNPTEDDNWEMEEASRLLFIDPREFQEFLLDIRRKQNPQAVAGTGVESNNG